MIAEWAGIGDARKKEHIRRLEKGFVETEASEENPELKSMYQVLKGEHP